MTDSPEKLRALRGLYLRAATEFVKTRFAHANTFSLSAADVQLVADYRDKILRIDDRIRRQRPGIDMANRLRAEIDTALRRRQYFREAVVEMEKLDALRAESGRYGRTTKKFTRRADKHLSRIAEQVDSLVDFTDTIAGLNSEADCNFSQFDDDDARDPILDEIVSSALKKPSDELGYRLREAIDSGTAISADADDADSLGLPVVPQTSP